MTENLRVNIQLDASVLGVDEVKKFLTEIKSITSSSQKAGSAVSDLGNSTKSLSSRGVASMAVKFTEVHMIANAIRTVISAIPEAMQAILTNGVRINSEFEAMRLGIASVMNAQTTIADSSGKQLEGAEKYRAALKLSEDQFKKIRFEALKTQATTEELAKNFQTAMSVGPQQGITNLETLRRLTVSITNAATAMNVEMARVPVSIRAVLTGRGVAQNVVARNLGVTLAEINSWKASGTLVEELTKRLDPFTEAANESAKSFKVMKSNVVEAFDIISSEATKGLFDELKGSMNEHFWDIFDFDTMTLSEKFKPIVSVFEQVFTDLGRVASEALDEAMAGIQNASQYVAEHKLEVQETTNAWTSLMMSLKDVGASLVSTLGLLLDFGVVSGLLYGLGQGLSFFLAAVSDGLKYLTGGVQFLVGAILAGLDMIVAKIAETLNLDWIAEGFKGAAQSMFSFMARGLKRIQEGAPDSATSSLTKWEKALDRIGEAADRAAGKVSGVMKMSPEDQKAWDAFNAGLEARFAPKVTGAAFPKKPKSNLTAASKLDKLEADRSLSLLKIQNELERQLLENRLKLNLISYREYYDRILEMQNDLTNKEVKVLEKEKRDVSSVKTSVGSREALDQRNKLFDIDTKIAVLREKQKNFSLTYDLPLEDQLRKVDNQVAKLKTDMLNFSGARISEADIAASVIEKYRDIRLRLAQEDQINGTDNVGLLDELINVESAKANLDEFQKQYDQVLQNLANKEKALVAEGERGDLTMSEVQEALVDVKKSKVDELQVLLEKMTQFANIIGDPAIQEKLAGMQIDVLNLKNAYTEMGKEMSTGLKDSFQGFFNDLGTGAKDLSHAFADMGRSIISSFMNIISRHLAEDLMESLFKSSSGGSAGFFSSLFGATAGKADGGYISGPGTGTSDSIPVRLSNGEYVLRASAVRNLGIGLLDKLNGSSSRPSYAFAEGGPVQSGIGPSINNQTKMSVVNLFDPSLVRDAINTPQGEMSILNVIKSNPQYIKALLS